MTHTPGVARIIPDRTMILERTHSEMTGKEAIIALTTQGEAGE